MMLAKYHAQLTLKSLTYQPILAELGVARPGRGPLQKIGNCLDTLIDDDASFASDDDSDQFMLPANTGECSVPSNHLPEYTQYYNIGQPTFKEILKLWHTGLEVDYPIKAPPFKMMLHEEDYNNSSDGPVPYFNAPTNFFHVLEKILTNEDTKSGVLKLSWHGFCEQALPREVTGQWLDICKKHRFVEGITVKFGVTHASHNKVIHLKIAPFIGVRTTLIRPRVAAGYKAFYQPENYFLL
ncbi:hypothetical protein TSUD_353720 [Trifolium subterraneum]|uniref:Uncharacterized protein n=1 Tax=Trifolium subterraneum TaxID=3900 RepID=A0A2Z6MRB9_TRISU|nr:hypothetical protein TSUD_353720 [Trifolium subterraneum]